MSSVTKALPDRFNRPGSARPPKRSTLERRSSRTGLLFVAPAAAVVAVFFIYPLCFAGWMSLNDWPLIGEPSFIGLDNFASIPDQELFVNAIIYTLVYTVLATVAVFGVGGLLAWLAMSKRPGVAIYRTIYFLPVIIGLGVSSLLWYAMFSNVVGPFDPILQGLGITSGPVPWLQSQFAATASILVMSTWKFAGFQMIVLVVGLQGIPAELYEAARMDGAAGIKLFRYVTLPLLRPTIALLLVLSISGSLLSFDQFFVMTGGGPQRSTVTMVLAMFREAFVNFNLGSASALAIVLLVGLVLVNLFQLKILRRQ
jgi:multiple sugar transport system permease protein